MKLTYGNQTEVKQLARTDAIRLCAALTVHLRETRKKGTT